MDAQYKEFDATSMATNIFSNHTTKTQNELFEGYSDELLTFASVACIIFIIIGVPGNLLTIIALSRGKQTRNSTAVFIINLSCSDLLFCCFNLPLAASTFMKRAWTHSDLLCRLFPLLRYGLLAVSLFTVSLITINRYIIIAHPRQYPRIYQHRYLAVMVAGTWITAFSIMIPTWRGIWGKFGLDTSIGSCSILHDKNDRSPKEFLFVAAFMVPCVCIVFCYARIFYLVRKAAFRTREPPTKSISFQNEDQPKVQSLQADTKCENPKATAKQISLEETSSSGKPFIINEDDIEYIDVGESMENMPISYSSSRFRPKTISKETTTVTATSLNKEETTINNLDKSTGRSNPVKTSIKTSFTRFTPRKTHYVSMGNTSNASSIYPGKMSQKDRRLLKMILVIFVSFLICYLPITITKIWKSTTNAHFVNISGYLLIYLTTSINPIIYVLMSLEYRQAYWNLLRCQTPDQKKKNMNDFNRAPKT